jgi:hypothetical protein
MEEVNNRQKMIVKPEEHVQKYLMKTLIRNEDF